MMMLETSLWCCAQLEVCFYHLLGDGVVPVTHFAEGVEGKLLTIRP